MSDSNNPLNTSYVDTYSPPQAAPTPVAPANEPSAAPPTYQVDDNQALALSAPVTPPAIEPQASSSAEAAPTTLGATSQSLEDQNIFFLLGVEKISDQEKEDFLDELQQVIWEDFLENDVSLLVTENELTELKQIMAKSYETDLDKQEAIVVYLEKLIPDLEEVMLEKALDLKQEMFDERLISMREVFAQDQSQLETIEKAADMIRDEKWREAAEVLNDLEV